MFGLIGNAGLQIKIEINPTPQSIQKQCVVPLDHQPSWKVSKNPFMAALSKRDLAQAQVSASVQQQQQMQQQQLQQPQGYQYNMNMQPQQQMIPSGPGAGPSMTTDRYGNSREVIYAYGEEEDVQGVAHLTLAPGKKFEHLGIKIEFVGRVDMSQAVIDGRSHYDFISQTKEVSPPSTLYQTQTSIPFYFRSDDKPHETYHGRNVTVRYFVRVIVERKFFPPIKHDQEMIVQLIKDEPRLNQPIKMEVGIEECLHIEFQYKKRYYHLNDVIEGNIHFMLVRIKIKYMELAVIRREMSGEGLLNNSPSANGAMGGHAHAPPPTTDGGNVVTETQTLTRFEIMDGAPVKGEFIPVRLYLGGIAADLTPTYDATDSRFAVKYYLNLVLVDEEDRRYFKQQEIILWRKTLG